MNPRLGRIAALVILAVALLAPGASRAETVEAPLRLSLVVRSSEETASGLRIRSIRLGTRDLVEALRDQLGQTGSTLRLVIRRPIEDLDFAQAHVFLSVDGAEFDVTNHIFRPELSLPFYSPARRSSVRADQVEVSFSDEGMDALRISNVAGTELTLAGIFRRAARLRTGTAGDLGYVFRSVKGTVIGGLQDLESPEHVAPVRGTVSIGPERLIEP